MITSTQNIKECVTGDAERIAELKARVRSEMGNIRMLPDVAAQALELAKNPDSPIEELARIVQQDVELATSVLSLANSALFAVTPTASLKNAIARVGFHRCKHLIYASSLTSLMKQMTLQEEWVRDVLWHHSQMAGVLATKLNQLLKTRFDGEEFTGGLIHDIGRSLLSVAENSRFTTFDPLDFLESRETPQREVEAIGWSHNQLGAWYAQEQGLPAALLDVIQHHHDPAASSEHVRLVALVALADELANHYHAQGQTAEFELREDSAAYVLEQHGIADAAARTRESAQQIITESIVAAAETLS